MGGLAGIVRFDGERPSLREAGMLSRGVAIRGPDHAGVFKEGPVILVHRRNKVHEGGRRQPHRGDRYVLVFDGRLYDHLDLARQVNLDPEQGKRISDGEVLLQAWEAWGPDCLERLDGAWAIAVWDRQEQALHLARGNNGTRPLFYATNSQFCAFASLPGPLMRLPWVSREVDPENLCEYLAFRYVHAPRTLLRDVMAVPPGCHVVVQPHGNQIRGTCHNKYATPGTALPNDEKALPTLERLIRYAISRRTHPGRSVGLLLSGGLDSSVVGWIARSAGMDLDTWHVRVESSGADEAAYAGRVARLLEARHHLVQVDPASFAGALDTCVRAMGVPPPTPSVIPQYLLLQAARAEHRVVLTGAGGDMLAAGGPVASVVAPFWAGLWRSLPGVGRLRGVLGDRWQTNATRILLGRHIGGTEILDAAARTELLPLGMDPHPRIRDHVLAPLYRGLDTDPVNAAIGVYHQGWLPEDTVGCLDRMGMASGVEVRYPLLDRQVLAFMNAQPGIWKLRIHHGQLVSKWPLRALLKDAFPRPIVERPKRPFPSPLHRWLRVEGPGLMQDRFDRLQESRWGLWRPDVVRSMLQQHLADQRNLGDRLWLLIMLDAWMEQVQG